MYVKYEKEQFLSDFLDNELNKAINAISHKSLRAILVALLLAWFFLRQKAAGIVIGFRDTDEPVSVMRKIREFKQRRQLRLRLRLRQLHEARILLVKKGKILVLHDFPCISLRYSTKTTT